MTGEYVYCSACAGSGEGMAEGTTCRTCKGSGEVWQAYVEPEEELDEETEEQA